MAAVQTDLRCRMLNSCLPALTAAAIFCALSGALMSGSGPPGCPNDRLLLPLAELISESGPKRHHQILPIVYVVIAAKTKWIIDQHSCSHILHNRCSIGSVNCIPIGQVLGQQHERDRLNSPRWPLPAGASQLRLTYTTAQDLSDRSVGWLIKLWKPNDEISLSRLEINQKVQAILKCRPNKSWE